MTQLTGTFYSNDSFELNALVNGVGMGAAVTLRCVSEITHDLNISVIGPDSGAPYPEVHFQGERRPEVTAAVAALKSLLDAVSPLGTNCITADGTHPGVRAYMQAHNSCAANARVAGSGHQRLTVAKAHLLVSSLGGQKGQTAYAQVRVINLSTDGETDPDVLVNNAALPGTFVSDEEFVIYQPTIAGFTMDPKFVMGWTLDTGISANVIIPADSIFPTHVDITKVAPRLTIQHNDASLMDAAKIPAAGIACAHADTRFFLRRRTVNGGLEPLASTVHIKGTLAGYAFHSKRYSASGSGVASGEVTIQSKEGVGGVPLAITTGVAIS